MKYLTHVFWGWQEQGQKKVISCLNAVQHATNIASHEYCTSVVVDAPIV